MVVVVWKVVFLGKSSVGKTSIITRYTTGQFLRDNATIGAAFISRQLKLDSEHTVQLDIWDTAGQERYRSLTKMYYRNTDVAIIVIDLSSFNSENTLDDIDIWIEELFKYNSKCCVSNNYNNSGGDSIPNICDKLNIVVVGNKIDLLENDDDKVVIRQKILQHLESKKTHNYGDPVIKYLEVSAKTGENISNLFEHIIVNMIPKDKLNATANESNGNNNIITLDNHSKRDEYINNLQCGC